ncbi:MAG: helix-turn-helix transcriptional regulator [Sporolactobacillus sp.]
MELHQRIKSKREELGWSQEKLADALNVSRQAVSKWENGSSYPDIEKLIDISDIFQISLDELIRGEEKYKKDRIIEKTSARPNFGDIFQSYWWLIFPIFGMIMAIIRALT